MTRKEAIKKIVKIISTQDSIREAEEIAYQNGITLTEIWAKPGKRKICYRKISEDTRL